MASDRGRHDVCTSTPPLRGHLVALTGDRRSEELTAHLEALGATVLHAPVLRTKAIVDDHAELRRATEDVIRRPPDHLVVTTAIGLRGWMNAAAAWGLGAELVAALRVTRVLARGPKAVGAVAEAGLDVWMAEPSGRTGAIVERLLAESIAGAHVVIQVPGAPMPELTETLRAAGADVTAIDIYDWTWPDDLVPATRLVHAIVEGRVSAVTFTSRPAVRNLIALAATLDLEDPLARALAHRVIPVCIGPVTAAALEDLTGAVAQMPERSILGMLAPTVADAVAAVHHHHVRGDRGDVIVQGRLVAGAMASVLLSEREAAVLDRLVTATRRTVGRDELLRAVWGDEDVADSVLETTIARLRRRIAKTDLTVRTVTARGYLLGGDVVACPALAPEPLPVGIATD